MLVQRSCQSLASMEEMPDACSMDELLAYQKLPEFASMEEYLNPCWHRRFVRSLLEKKSYQILSSTDDLPDPCRHKEVAYVFASMKERQILDSIVQFQTRTFQLKGVVRSALAYTVQISLLAQKKLLANTIEDLTYPCQQRDLRPTLLAPGCCQVAAAKMSSRLWRQGFRNCQIVAGSCQILPTRRSCQIIASLEQHPIDCSTCLAALPGQNSAQTFF